MTESFSGRTVYITDYDPFIATLYTYVPVDPGDPFIYVIGDTTPTAPIFPDFIMTPADAGDPFT